MTMFVVMNKAKWNSLGPEIQCVFESNSRKWIDVHGERWDQGDRESLAYANSLKNEILELSSDESLGWK